MKINYMMNFHQANIFTVIYIIFGGKISYTFKKFSVFINQKIFNDKQVIRDYKQIKLYIKNNNSTFQHEHIIYASYFVQKLIKT